MIRYFTLNFIGNYIGGQMKHSRFKIMVFLAGLLAAAGAHADDTFHVNGFGYQDYRQTNGNVQDGADQRGTWENDIIAFVVSAKVSDRDTAWAQLESTATEPTAFTWAFLDHRFNDDLSVHIGRVKFPLGLYNEFVDNKWLQLGVIHPSIYSAAADMVYDAYTGIGVDWTTGSLFTQVYAGHVYDNPPQDTAAVPFSDRRMFGGRITWSTPYEGLRFLVSANRTQIESTAAIPYVPGQGEMGHEDRAILSVDYVSDRFDIKGEYAAHKIGALSNSPALNANAWYLQGGYKIGLWAPYVRYDSFVGDTSNSSDPSLYQKEQVAGVGYKINSNVNARIEYHWVKGWGLTENTALGITSSAKTDWNQVAAGINFIF
jgi:hypothetical protein